MSFDKTSEAKCFLGRVFAVIPCLIMAGCISSSNNSAELPAATVMVSGSSTIGDYGPVTFAWHTMSVMLPQNEKPGEEIWGHVRQLKYAVTNQLERRGHSVYREIEPSSNYFLKGVWVLSEDASDVQIHNRLGLPRPPSSLSSNNSSYRLGTFVLSIEQGSSGVSRWRGAVQILPREENKDIKQYRAQIETAVDMLLRQGF